MSSKRARRRRKGKRLEAAKAEQKRKVAEQNLMWARLANTKWKRGVGYKGQPTIDSGFFYAPYMPTYCDGGFSPIVLDTTA